MTTATHLCEPRDLPVYRAHLRRRGIEPGTDTREDFKDFLGYWLSKTEAGREAERREFEEERG